MIEQFIQEISKRRDKYAKGPAKVHHTSESWTECKAWRPRKTVFVRWIWPGQPMFRYRHGELCMNGNRRNGMPSMYFAWFHMYLTPEEYTMLKLYDEFDSRD